MYLHDFYHEIYQHLDSRKTDVETLGMNFCLIPDSRQHRTVLGKETADVLFYETLIHRQPWQAGSMPAPRSSRTRLGKRCLYVRMKISPASFVWKWMEAPRIPTLGDSSNRSMRGILFSFPTHNAGWTADGELFPQESFFLF